MLCSLAKPMTKRAGRLCHVHKYKMYKVSALETIFYYDFP